MEENAQTNNKIVHIEQVTAGRVSFNQNASVQFATILVANLMLVNSGALFTFSSLLGKPLDTAFKSVALTVATCFVVGIVCATLCGYSAYLNFIYHAQREAITGQETVFDLQYPDAKNGQAEVDTWRSELRLNQKKI